MFELITIWIKIPSWKIEKHGFSAWEFWLHFVVWNTLWKHLLR